MSGNTSSTANREVGYHGHYSESRTGTTFAGDFDYLLNYSSAGTSFPLDNRMLLSSVISFPSDVSANLNSMGHNFPPFFPNGQKSSMPGTNHVCRVCAKTFRASSLLDIHMRVHVGAKPFVCPICGHRATQKGNLKLHMKKHHGADLPPHIDLVPDSGIWGHPQENIFCSTSNHMPDVVDSCCDASGKRKQVAQAVSSLLNEEVVELIKKYQNNAGQATTGTITESLEDFIRVAKNKEGGVTKMAAEYLPTKRQDEKLIEQKKKRMAISVRFKPYSPEGRNPNCIYSTAYGGNSLKMNTFEQRTNCLMCGKSLITRRSLHKLNTTAIFSNIPKTKICDECCHLQPKNDLEPAWSLASYDTPEKDDASMSDTPATINSVISEETSKMNSDRCHATCNLCGTVFVHLPHLKMHKEQCHAPKRRTQPITGKDYFLSYLGLASDMAPTGTDVATDTRVLNPVISHMTWLLSRNRSRNKRVIHHYLTQPSSELSKSKNVSEKLAGPSDKVNMVEEEPASTKKRASLSVLNILRQALLNSADQKASLNLKKAQMSAVESSYFREGSPTEVLEDSRTPQTSQYRNSAMQSLADIGKSLVLPENTHKKVIFAKRPPSDEIFTNDIQEQNNNGYRCQFCPKWFKYRSVLEIHMRSHTGERPYKCPYCEYAGTQHNCLKLHIQRHHPMKYEQNNMDTTGLSGVTNFQMSMAEPMINKASCFSPVNCPVCGRVSPSPGYLKIHMRSHKKSLDHVCHVCGRGFKEYWYLTTHLKTHDRELSSLKLNMQPSTTLTMGHLNSKINLLGRLGQTNDRKEIAAFGNHCEESRISQTQFSNRAAMNSKRMYNSTVDVHHPWLDNEVKISNNQESSSESSCPTGHYPEDRGICLHPSTDAVSSGRAISRTRRRKASFPSRVVLTPYYVPKSSPRHNISSLQCTLDKELSMISTAMQNEENGIITDDLPLDLRCPSKKMNDQNNNTHDTPMNLCKT